MVELHGAILGATALVEAFPYTVPKFMRESFTQLVTISDRIGHSQTLGRCTRTPGIRTRTDLDHYPKLRRSEPSFETYLLPS